MLSAPVLSTIHISARDVSAPVPMTPSAKPFRASDAPICDNVVDLAMAMHDAEVSSKTQQIILSTFAKKRSLKNPPKTQPTKHPVEKEEYVSSHSTNP